jgi:hypothetical protein
MMRINNESLEPIHTTDLKSEGFYEEDNLHEWFINNPEYFLEEELLVIGNEVRLQATNDRIDVLAIDRDANLTVVELKRGKLKNGVESQGLNYVSHIAEWGYEEIEQRFDKFKNGEIGQQLYDQKTDLDEELRKFTEQDEIPNNNQRMVYIGERLGHRTEKVTRWLSSQGIDVTVAVFEVYRDNERIYLDTTQELPEGTQRNEKTGGGFSKEPWKDQGRDWHLDKMEPEAGELLEDLVEEFGTLDEFGDPSWNQRYYVAFYQNRERVVQFSRRKTQVNLDISLSEDELEQIDVETIVSSTGIPRDDIDTDDSLYIVCKPEQSPNIEALVDIVSEHLY